MTHGSNPIRLTASTIIAKLTRTAADKTMKAEKRFMAAIFVVRLCAIFLFQRESGPEWEGQTTLQVQATGQLQVHDVD